MSTAFYDIIIVGTELPGCILGAICAKQGYRVLVVGQGTRDALYRHEGFTMPRTVGLHYGFETSPAIKQVFSELSMSLEMRNLPKPLSPYFQVVLPHGRVDVGPKEHLFERELAREFPGDLEDIRAFYARVRELDAPIREVLEMRLSLPPTGIRERFSFRGLAKRFPFLEDEWTLEDPLSHFPHGHPFRAFALAPFRFISGLLPARPNPPTLVRAVTEAHHGLLHIEGGLDGIRQLFLSRIKDRYGDLRQSSRVDTVIVKRGRATEVRLKDRGELFGCNALVCNMDVRRFFSLVPGDMAEAEYHNAIMALSPVYHTFTCNFVVKARAVPEAMARHVFSVFDVREPLEEDNCIHFAVNADGRYLTDDRDVRIITATCRVPPTHATGGVEVIDALCDRIQYRLASIVPFLDEHLIVRHTPWLAEDEQTGAITIDTTEAHPVFGEAVPQMLGASPVACRTGYKNILVGGNTAFSGFGFEGAFVAALNLFTAIQDIAPLKQVL